jgi:hypothetical protein
MNVLDLCGDWQLGWADGVRSNATLAECGHVDPARLFPAQVTARCEAGRSIFEYLIFAWAVRLGLNGEQLLAIAAGSLVRAKIS